MIRAEPTPRKKELRSGLGAVVAGVRVLGAEGRPERMDLGQREAVHLDIELPRDRQKRLATEQVLHEIDLAFRRRRLRWIEVSRVVSVPKSGI
jgi:hypothetical protein